MMGAVRDSTMVSVCVCVCVCALCFSTVCVHACVCVHVCMYHIFQLLLPNAAFEDTLKHPDLSIEMALATIRLTTQNSRFMYPTYFVCNFI